MAYYDETFYYYKNKYESKDYYLEWMGNTIYIMTKPKFLRRSKTKFCLIMAHPQCNEDTIEYVLFSYGFRKKKER